MRRDRVEMAEVGVGDTIAGATRRTWEDRIALRFPRVYRKLAGAILWPLFRRLPAGHRVRCALTKRYISRSYGAFNRGDLDVLACIYHPELVWDWSHFDGWLDDPVLHGPEGLRKGFLTWREMWGGLAFEASEIRDFGDKQMVTAHMRASGSGSGASVETTFWQVGYGRDGLIAWLGNYTSRQEALDAARHPS